MRCGKASITRSGARKIGCFSRGSQFGYLMSKEPCDQKCSFKQLDILYLTRR